MSGRCRIETSRERECSEQERPPNRPAAALAASVTALTLLACWASSSRVAAILAACERRGLRLVDVIEDAGYSAKDLKRPGVRIAFEMLQAGGADALVVAKLGRLSRSMLDFAGIMAAAQKQRRGLIALDCAVGSEVARIVVELRWRSSPDFDGHTVTGSDT
jgi:Resolvase, N terminal domain